MLSIGDFHLSRDLPGVAAGFKDANSVDNLFRLKAGGLDIAEIRVDLFESKIESDIRNELAKFKRAGIPTLFTIRTEQEGGEWCGDYVAYFQLISKFVSDVDSVDIEVNAIRQHKAESMLIVDRVHREGKLVIASFHDFDKTPTESELVKVLRDAKDSGADVVKIATNPKSSDDVELLTKFTMAYKNENLIVIAMGAEGLISRLCMPRFGSLVTFGYANGMPTAPGQLKVERLIELLRMFYPKYNQNKIDHLQLLESA